MKPRPRTPFSIAGRMLFYGLAAVAGVSTAHIMPHWVTISFVGLAAIGMAVALFLVYRRRGKFYQQYKALPRGPSFAVVVAFVVIWTSIGLALGILPEWRELWAGAAIVIVLVATAIRSDIRCDQCGSASESGEVPTSGDTKQQQ